jgi:hypothetical protein
MSMSIFSWFKGKYGVRGKAISLYRSGMTKAHRHDHQGAIRDYTAAISLPDIPPDLRAMALYNRALVYSATKDDLKAVDDLRVVLAMRQTPPDVREEAKRKLVRMDRRSSAGNA